MTAKKIFSNHLPAQAARILKIAGLTVTLVSLFDILISPVPYQWGDRQWQIETVTAVVERGIRLLVGIALFLTGYGISREPISESRSGRAIWQDPRFWALALASLLGLALSAGLSATSVQRASRQSRGARADQQKSRRDSSSAHR